MYIVHDKEQPCIAHTYFYVSFIYVCQMLFQPFLQYFGDIIRLHRTTFSSVHLRTVPSPSDGEFWKEYAAETHSIPKSTTFVTFR